MTGITTPLTRLLGIPRPILLAGMAGGPTTPELVAAVSRAGGLGVFGLAGMSTDAVRRDVAAAVQMAGGAPVGVNVLISPAVPRPGADPDRVAQVLAPIREAMGLPHPPPQGAPPATPRELVEAGLEAGATVVATGLGDPAVVADAARDAGAPLVAMVSTVDDARRVVEAGAHAVVAQGSEAGGHRSNFEVPEQGEVPLVGTMALVRQVVRAVDVPVVAAGGIMDGAGMAAALALGASGVQLGTALLVAGEAGVPAGWRSRIRHARDDETIITRALSGRPARGLPNGPPIRPGPAVTATASISDRRMRASASACPMISSRHSTCARAAISGTTPPKARCSSHCERMTLDRMRPFPSASRTTTAAAVSSQLVSMPSTASGRARPVPAANSGALEAWVMRRSGTIRG